jgi:hypothetical protein
MKLKMVHFEINDIGGDSKGTCMYYLWKEKQSIFNPVKRNADEYK